MDCRTANRLIVPFLEQELELEETEGLLRHVRECASCREDLEIYYTVRKGIDGLNQDQFETYDLKQQFENDIRRAEGEVRRGRYFLLFHGIAVLGGCIAAAVAVFIQMARWF